MIKLTAAFVALLLAAPSLAQQPVYAQCGGQGWSGSTDCASGSTCVVSNQYYSQCLPGAAAPAPAATTPAPAATTPAPAATQPAPAQTTTSPSTDTTGWISISGQNFVLGGQNFVVAGTNAYWLAQLSATADINKAFSDMASLGVTICRTWGFNDVTSPSGTYYQLWTDGTATINTGATGLGKFDTVVAAAKANGIRLIVTLTNNWSDYGGMDVYVTQILGSSGTHDQFYTSSKIISAYEKYIQAWVTHYANEPTIMAWELANEPRCAGSGGVPSSSSCNPATITTWAGTISKFIKSIDSKHLVGIGDEGFYNDPGNSDYPYGGGPGVDFAANLAISTLDFGTFHLYPSSWGETNDWGTTWIANHATTQKSVGKPVILEEFGVTTDQSSVYQTWYSEAVSSGLTGVMYWQAGSHLSTGDSPQDGYAIYPDSAAAPTIQAGIAALKAARA